MNDLLFARWQMGTSLAFHIVFAAVGIAMPALMVAAEYKWLRTRDDVYLQLTRRWAKGTAIFFAVGAVSGTVLSFELGLLWPEFMRHAGPIIGLPFSMEGFAFFAEAIFLGVYLYGWNRVSPWAHWCAGVIVAISGALSGLFVVAANSWMNTPSGFVFKDGQFGEIDPIAAMLNPGWLTESIHMLLAAYLSTAAAVAGIHAFMLLRTPTSAFHKAALKIALVLLGTSAVLQPISGDFQSRHVARLQPVKLAAMEGQYNTERGAPIRIGGWPDDAAETTPYAIEIPYGLSLLAYHDPHAEVKGLKEVPKADRPPVLYVHLSFQVMVGCGMYLLILSLIGVWLWRRKTDFANQRLFLKALVFGAPLGFVALETGWMVTELGRQPWIVMNIMRTSAAVTPMPNLVVPFAIFLGVYVMLAWVVIALLWRQVADTLKPVLPREPAPSA